MNDNQCEKHDRKKAHTGGNITLCPECELEYYKQNPEEIQEKLIAERIEDLTVPEDLKQ